MCSFFVHGLFFSFRFSWVWNIVANGWIFCVCYFILWKNYLRKSVLIFFAVDVVKSMHNKKIWILYSWYLRVKKVILEIFWSCKIQSNTKQYKRVKPKRKVTRKKTTPERDKRFILENRRNMISKLNGASFVWLGVVVVVMMGGFIKPTDCEENQKDVDKSLQLLQKHICRDDCYKKVNLLCFPLYLFVTFSISLKAKGNKDIFFSGFKKKNLRCG